MSNTILDEWISPKYLNYTAAKRLKQKYKQQRPYPHHALPNFFIDRKIRKVRKALLKQDFKRKEADLFSFFQTADLRDIRNPVLRSFYRLFNSQEFKEYIGMLTGTKLSKKLDMSGFVYGDTDYLLPHDDRLETRKVAFIVNLTSRFSKRDGGSLGLFTVRGSRPVRMTKQYTPALNTLFLFTVTRKSFHQVTEVRTTKKRISFAGWFHGLD